MEDLLARYLDGDLDEAGAAELLRRSREDPALAQEMREYESLLEAAERLGPERAPDGLADRVLDAVTSTHAVPPRSRPARRGGDGGAWGPACDAQPRGSGGRAPTSIAR